MRLSAVVPPTFGRLDQAEPGDTLFALVLKPGDGWKPTFMR